jgi:hypothetical protein
MFSKQRLFCLLGRGNKLRLYLLISPSSRARRLLDAAVLAIPRRRFCGRGTNDS